ncbi:hypothetical protein HPP92_002804 [Vanilla planifolia]|uniref:Uncharacterized protein n=1 Tax=Vanilla planifolia TaxID=51239 RepID=A0A835VIB0_VANPL|nr:hypothetical protein HPP92_002804 [Vanilla planifolia]
MLQNPRRSAGIQSAPFLPPSPSSLERQILDSTGCCRCIESAGSVLDSICCFLYKEAKLKSEHALSLKSMAKWYLLARMSSCRAVANGRRGTHPWVSAGFRKSSTSTWVCLLHLFGRTSAGNDGSCPPGWSGSASFKPLTSDDNDISTSSKNENSSKKKVCLKSSLKRPREDHTGVSSIACESSEVVSISRANDRRKVQWTDACGRELIQIREFECSDADASDDEHENGGHNKCLCVIQ